MENKPNQTKINQGETNQGMKQPQNRRFHKNPNIWWGGKTGTLQLQEYQDLGWNSTIFGLFFPAGDNKQGNIPKELPHSHFLVGFWEFLHARISGFKFQPLP